MKVIVLYNLGGPENLRDVESFLYDLLSDRDLTPFPRPMQLAFAWTVSKLRLRKVKKKYEEMGGGSPLVPTMRRIAVALETCFAQSERGDVVVRVAVRHGKPSFESVIAEAQAAFGIESVSFLFVPLYPHRSAVTTESAEKHIKKVCASLRCSYQLANTYATDLGFIEVWAENILFQVSRVPVNVRKVHLLFSAHSIPQKLVEKGDPYLAEIQATVAAIVAFLHQRGLEFSWSLSFQSRLGPIRWLGPDTATEAQRLIHEGVRLLLIPVSFTVDNLETIHELGMELRETLSDEFECVACPNDNPAFVKCLFRLSAAALDVG